MTNAAAPRASHLREDEEAARWRVMDQIVRKLLSLAEQIDLPAADLAQRFTNMALERARGKAALSTPGSAKTLRELHAQAQIMEQWFRDLDFMDGSGRPRPLPQSAGRHSFAALVRRAAPTISARTALGLLLKAKAVKLNAHGHVVPLSFGLIDPAAKVRAAIGLHAVNNLLRTVVTNLYPPPPKGLFQRESVTFRFDRRQLPRANLHLRAQAIAQLEQMDDWMHQYQLPEGASSDNAVNVIVGIYMALEESVEQQKKRPGTAVRRKRPKA